MAISSPNFQEIKSVIRAESLICLQRHARRPRLGLGEVSSDLGVYSYWMSLVLLSGAAARITFKVHYDVVTAKVFASDAFCKKSAEVSKAEVQDFFKEYCNLTAGAIKRQFYSWGVEMGASLPLLTRGFDQIFAPLGDFRHQTVSDAWEIGDGSQRIVCTSYLEVLDVEAVSMIKAGQVLNVQEGEVDFL